MTQKKMTEAELNEAMERFKKVRIPAIMFRTAFLYAKEAADCFRSLRYAPTIRASRWINEFEEHLNYAYASNDATEMQKIDNSLTDSLEEYLKDFYSRLWTACQNGVRQHHVGEQIGEYKECGMVYGACAHVLMDWALSWKKQVSPNLQDAILHPKVKHFFEACEIFAHGDYETKDKQVELCRQILTAKWQQVITDCFNNEGKIFY